MIARTTTSILAAVLGLGAFAAPADAQMRQRVVEVFGDDKCPEGTSQEIVICAKKPESDRFRIPTEFREPAAADRESQESRVEEMVAEGRSGPGSCSPQGPGGFTGCFQRQVEANRAERRAVRRARQEEPR